MHKKKHVTTESVGLSLAIRQSSSIHPRAFPWAPSMGRSRVPSKGPKWDIGQ